MIVRIGFVPLSFDGPGGGSTTPAIALSANTLIENSATGTAIGTLSTVNTSGTAAFTLVDSASNKVRLAGTNNVNAQAGTTPADYETATSFTFSVSVSGVTPPIPGSTTFTVVVSDVLEMPNAPVLAMDPAWVTTDATPDFIADFDATVGAGDDVRLQIQAAGGDWSVLLSDTTHTITAPEDAANEASLSSGSLSNGNYSARCNVTHGSASGWSNTVSFTVAAAAPVPVNSVAPVISGTTRVTQVLTTTNGTWSNSPTGYTYQWKRAGSNIAGATASTYTLVELDAGAAITCAVTASNASGPGSPTTSNSLTTDVYLVYLGHTEDPTDTAIYSSGTFGSGGWQSAPLGTAAANRKIIVAFTARNSSATGGTINAATVAGQTLTQQVIAFSDTQNNKASILVANVPTGTSGNISITLTQAQNRAGAGVWAMYGAGSSTASYTDKTENAADGNVTLTVPAKGVAVGVSYHQTAGTATWTGLTGRYDAVLEAAIEHAGADLNSNAGGNINMISDWNVADTNGAHAFASWGP
jgi:hypothetical protein